MSSDLVSKPCTLHLQRGYKSSSGRSCGFVGWSEKGPGVFPRFCWYALCDGGLAQSKWNHPRQEIPFTAWIRVSFSHVFEEASPVCLLLINLGPQKCRDCWRAKVSPGVASEAAPEEPPSSLTQEGRCSECGRELLALRTREQDLCVLVTAPLNTAPSLGCPAQP